jgi:DNA-binding CsgD family transcriptional regulator
MAVRFVAGAMELICGIGSSDVTDLELELAEIAASSVGLRQRADSFLASLRRWVPFDAAWMALADTQHPQYTGVADMDLDDSVREYLGGPVVAGDIEATGCHRRQPPLSPSDLTYARSDLRTWSECLMPAGFNEGLSVALFEPGGRHVGFLALLYAGTRPPPPGDRSQLARATSAMGRGMDPVRTLTWAAQMVKGAASGVVLRRDGTVDVVPGLTMDPLLRAGATVLGLARAHIRAGHAYTTFLWPARRERLVHLRVTVMAAAETTPTKHLGMVLLSPADDLRGLTPRELEVLGYLVDGCSNQEVSHHLVLAPRTVAAHLEHILAKLQAPTRTLAAVRACQEGLYVPVAGSRGSPSRDEPPSDRGDPEVGR